MTLQGLPILSHSENLSPYRDPQDCTQLSSLLFPSALLSAFLTSFSHTGLPTVLPAQEAPSYLRAFALATSLHGTFSPQIPSRLTPSLPSNVHSYVTFSVSLCLTYFKTGLCTHTLYPHPLTPFSGTLGT